MFPRFLVMVDDCPTCGHHFERDAGYWIGAMIVSTAFALAAFAVVFAGGILSTWPNVPWNLILISTLTVTTLVPVLFYPTSRTVWVALDLAVRPLEPHEVERSAKRLDR